MHERSGRADRQSLFAIIQGGLDLDLRAKCLDAMILRKDHIPGYAIGGLSGGEEKGTQCLSIINDGADQGMFVGKQMSSGKCEELNLVNGIKLSLSVL